MLKRIKYPTNNILYRKCEWTNRIIYSKDISSATINIATVDEEGKKNGKIQVSLSGFVRQSGRGPEALELILKKRNVFPFAK